MKKMMISWLLVLLMLVPMATGALAEGNGFGSVVLENIVLTMPEKEPMAFGFRAELAGGGNEDSGIVKLMLDGAGNRIVDLQMAMENDALMLGLGGMANNYTVTMAELNDLMTQSMEASGQSMPLDSEVFTNYINAYVKLIEEAANMEKHQQQSPKEALEMLTAMGAVKGAQEEVEIYGEKTLADRYDLTFKMSEMDKIMAVSYEKMPSMKEFMAAYAALMNSVMGDEMNIEPERMYASLVEQSGMDVEFAITMWFTEAADKMRMEFSDMTMIQGEETQTVALPFVCELLVDETGTHLRYNLDAEIEGETVVFHMEMNDAMLTEGAKLDFVLSANIDEQSFAMDFVADYGAAGAGSAAMNMSVMGEPVATFTATSTGGDVNSHHVVLDVNAEGQSFGLVIDAAHDLSGKGDFAMSVNAMGMTMGTASVASTGGDVNTHSVTFDLSNMGMPIVAFDVIISESAMPAPLFADGGKPTVSITQLTDEDMAKLQEEASAMAFIAVGQLMQTEGVAQFMTEMMTMAPVMEDVGAADYEADAPAA